MKMDKNAAKGTFSTGKKMENGPTGMKTALKKWKKNM